MQCPGEATDKCNNKTKPPVSPYGVRKGGCGEGLQLSPERYMKDNLEEIQANKHRRKKNLAVYNFLDKMDNFVLYCPHATNRCLLNTRKMENLVSHLILPEVS